MNWATKILAVIALIACAPAVGQTPPLVLQPIADAYVLNGTWAGSNFGTAGGLYAKSSSNQIYDSYLKFDVSSVSSVALVKFRVNASKSASGSLNMSLYSVADTTWGETSITWNNKPARGNALATTAVTGTSWTYYELDITNYVVAEKAAGRNIISVALHVPVTSSQLISMRSREWGSNPPELMVTVNPSAAPQLHFIHADHLNTPRLVANQSGQTVWRWDQQEPFGVSVPDTNPSGLGSFEFNLRFPGQYFDKETNLHYNYFRDYDATLGRYTGSDQIGLMAGLNTYAYVASNPLSWIDALGLYTEIIQWGPIYFSGGHWGHISANIDGQNLSFGPRGWDTTYPTAAEYTDRQVDVVERGGRGIILDLSPIEEALLKQCLQSSERQYASIKNNCGNPFLQCLEELGVVDTRDKARVLPTDVYRIISKSPRVIGRTTYGEGFPGLSQPQ